MNFLFTADWQVDWSNIDQCRTAWKCCVHYAVESKLEGIANLGDMKQQYNPVDIRVTKFWLWAITYAKERNLRLIFILGNHDRVGQYTDAQNWLPIFRKMGAETYDKPDIAPMRDGSRMFILPFDSSPARLRGSAARLLDRKPHARTDVLVFHANLKGCQFNQLGQKSEGVVRAKDLYPHSYRYCIGGDVHMPQKIGKNVYYTGSPFSMDWGEANQNKRFIVVQTQDVGSDDIRFLPSPIPGHFDPTWPGFDRRRVGKNAKVRIHVKCSASENYGRTLERARKAAIARYPGAEIYPQAEFEDERDSDIRIKATDSDRRKIAIYLADTLPTDLVLQRKKILSYLVYQLEQAAGGMAKRNAGLQFQKALGRNFLSFKNVNANFKTPGIVVVQGKNKDWSGRSNGSGKTNFLQLIPVALFGTTFKGQKYDNWARRFTAHKASVRLILRDNRGRKVIVERSRRPTALKLSVNGIDQSSGMRSSARDATQGLIEQLTGFTWQTLANAVYIDQSVTRAFLGGTNKERTAVLSKFQNLERFEKAQLRVKSDKAKIVKSIERVGEEIAVAIARIEECREALADAHVAEHNAKREAKKQWHNAVAKAAVAGRIHKRLAARLEKKRRRLAAKITKMDKLFVAIERKAGEAQAENKALLLQITKARAATGVTACPTCLQPVDHKLLRRRIDEWQNTLMRNNAALLHAEQEVKKANLRHAGYEGEYDAAGIRILESKQRYQQLESKAEYCGDTYKALLKEDSTAKRTIRKYRRRVRILRRRKKILKMYRRQLELSQGRLEYCERAFSRDGIPAFLNRLLAPMLNKAAEYYAKLFGEKYIQVRFEVNEGEFEPKILNASGGENLDDQSVGEKALAGLIASFALREVAPACNLLVLDEPGDGLDATNARQFARALPQLKDRFGLIMLTTHNPYILAELSGERKITVVKRNRISRVV